MGKLFTISKVTKTDDYAIKPKFKNYLGRGLTSIAYLHPTNEKLVHVYTIEPTKIEYARLKGYDYKHYGILKFTIGQHIREKRELDVWVIEMPRLYKLSRKEQIKFKNKIISPLLKEYKGKPFLNEMWAAIEESKIHFPDKLKICEIAAYFSGDIFPDLSARQFMKDENGIIHCVDNGISKNLLKLNLWGD